MREFLMNSVPEEAQSDKSEILDNRNIYFREKRTRIGMNIVNHRKESLYKVIKAYKTDKPVWKDFFDY